MSSLPMLFTYCSFLNILNRYIPALLLLYSIELSCYISFFLWIATYGIFPRFFFFDNVFSLGLIFLPCSSSLKIILPMNNRRLVRKIHYNGSSPNLLKPYSLTSLIHRMPCKPVVPGWKALNFFRHCFVSPFHLSCSYLLTRHQKVFLFSLT